MDSLILILVLIFCRFLYSYLNNMPTKKTRENIIRLFLVIFGLFIIATPMILVKHEILNKSITNILISIASAIYFLIFCSRKKN